MKIQFTITKTDIDQAYQHALAHAVTDTTIKGFRKGKAPKKLVEEKIGESVLQRKAVEEVIPKAYVEQIKSKNLKPITYPEINLKTVEKNGDWIFEAEIIQKPEIKLGQYQKALKSASTSLKSQKTKIWLPGEKSPSNEEKLKNQNSAEDATLKLIFDTLLDTISFKVPQLLVDRQVKQSLSQLVSQLEKLGLNLDDYLKSINKTNEQLTEEYQKTASDSLKLEFILQEIAMDQKIDVTDEELEALVKTIPQSQHPSDQDRHDYLLNLKLILLKRKTIDRLAGFLN